MRPRVGNLLLLLLVGGCGASFVFHRCCYRCSTRDDYDIRDSYDNYCVKVNRLTNRNCKVNQKQVCYEFHVMQRNHTDGTYYSYFTKRWFGLADGHDCRNLMGSYTYYKYRACNYCNSDLCNDQYPDNLTRQHVDGLYDDMYPDYKITAPVPGAASGRDSNWRTVALSALVGGWVMAAR